MSALPDTEALAKLLAEATPGPWHMKLSDNATPHIMHEGGDWTDIQDHDALICAMPAEIVRAYNAFANARLIALAPTLAAQSIAYAARIAVLEAENAKLREAQKWQDEQRARAFLRRFIVAPEDRAVADLCERHGYGAVMDAASRIWAREDGIGAFYVGGCIGFRSYEEARAALTRP